MFWLWLVSVIGTCWEKRQKIKCLNSESCKAAYLYNNSKVGISEARILEYTKMSMPILQH